MKRKTAFFNNDISDYKGACSHVLDYIYADSRRQRIEEISDLYPEVITAENFPRHVSALREIEAIFSTWGMPLLSVDQIDALSSLQCIFYAAGATAGFRQPYLERGVRVCSATRVNAIPVAEFCLGHVLLATKGYLRNSREATCPKSASQNNVRPGPGNYGTLVALIGNGSVSRRLQGMLGAFDLDLMVVDSGKGDITAELERAFSEAYVISNHLPDLATNRGLFKESHFAAMREGATFINTGRGPQVNHDGLIEIFQKRPDLTAVLDVQDPEPPLAGSPLYALSNVYISQHIAGAMHNEVLRMADCVIDDFERWTRGDPLLNEIESWML